MAARSAPVVGLAAASILLTAVGVTAISLAGESKQPFSYAGSVTLESSTPATTAAPSTSSAAASSSAIVVPKVTKTAAPPTKSTPPTSVPPPSSSPVQQYIQPSLTATPKPVVSKPTRQALDSSSNESFARAVFDAVNQARRELRLPPLTWSSQLASSAHQHNLAMATANTLAHQVGNEDSLGLRETKAGVQWSFAAENIGWTTVRTLSGALGIEASMLGETPPNDAHRLNILSKDAHALGVAVLIDHTHGRLWLTQDFADVP